VKTGDLVKIRSRAGYDVASQIGVIIDALEQSDGFYVLEVASDGDIAWYSDLDLQLISEST
jgi:hypothetical protein